MRILTGNEKKGDDVMFSKVKGLFALVFGGYEGLIKYAVGIFNENVLAKIPNKETAAKYLSDAQAVCTLIRVVLANHGDSFTEGRKASLEAILAAIEELSKALEDFTVSESEIEAITEKVKDAITVWKKAKK